MYHTPCPNSPQNLTHESLEQSHRSIEAAEPVSSSPLFPRKEKSLASEKYEGRAKLSTVFERTLADGSNAEEISQETPNHACHLIKTVDRGSAYIPYDDALSADQRPFEHESTGHNQSSPEGNACITQNGWDPDSSFSGLSPRDKQLDRLSVNLSTNLSIRVPAAGRESEFCQEVTRIDESVKERAVGDLQYCVNPHHNLQIGKTTDSGQGFTCSDQSDYSISENGTSSISENDSQTSVSSGSRPASEAAVKEALALRAKGRSIDTILSDLGCGSNDTCSKFCRDLWKLCFSFEKKNLLEEVSIALDLIQVGYTRVFGSSSTKAMHCLVYKARILRKRKEYKDSESTYRQAISGLRNLKETKYQLICQLFLADFLRSLDKMPEALYLLLETLIEHFNSTITSIKSKATEVMGSMQRLHLKMDVDQNMVKVMASVTRLQELQSEYPTTYYGFNVWVEFVRLGSCYSEVEKFDMADLCFSYLRPVGYEGTNPFLKIELARFHKERSLHDRRQSRVVDSLVQLKVAFKHLASVEPPDKYDQALATDMKQLLDELKSQAMQAVGNSSLQSTAWDQARETFQIFVARRRIKEIREREMMQREESRSPSSRDSSMFSGGSASSRLGVTYSAGSESSIVSNSAFIAP